MEQTSGGLRRRPRVLLGVLVYCGLVVAMIGTLGTPLIPTIAAAQHVSLTTAQWLLTLTIMVGAVATPVLGRLGDGPNRRAVLAGGLVAVVIGSVVAATATRFDQLLVGRGMMGVGMGLVPVAMAIAREHLPAHRLGPGVAALSITAATGAGLGYPLSGLLADAVDYHAGFWLAAGLSAVGVVAALLVVPGPMPDAPPAAGLDVPGTVLFGGALATLLIALSMGTEWGWTAPSVLGLILMSVALTAAWAVVELRTRRPLVQLRYLTKKLVLIADLTAVLAGFGMFLMMTLVNRLAQAPTSSGYGFGESAGMAGLVLTPLAVGTVTANRSAGALYRRAGSRGLMITGIAAIAIALFGLAVARDHLIELGAANCLLGLGIGLAFAAMPALIIRSVPLAETGSATGFNQVLRYAGGAMGSALGAALLAAHTPAGAAQPASDGYTIAFLAGGVVCLVAAVVAAALPGRDAAESGTDPRPVHGHADAGLVLAENVRA
jgi:predicted MFS family arabinose efflux permease